MPRVHFLNVKNGDCSIIQHASGRVSVVDVSCAVAESVKFSYSKSYEMLESVEHLPVPGNFGQKHYPDNPINYLNKIGVSSIFRFILTHPDMDHLDGIKDLFSSFPVCNFWDTANTKELSTVSFGQRTRLRDNWEFYKSLRDGGDDWRKVYYSGNSFDFFKGDGLRILAPTPTLIQDANRRGDWNDASYVFSYHTFEKKILFCGDSEDETWTHLLKTWPNIISDVDILIAPHHGRKSGRDFKFLNVVKPKLAIFGNAGSEHLMYDACRNRGIPVISNNMAGYIVLDIDASGITVWVKHDNYAQASSNIQNVPTWYNANVDGWYVWAV